MEKIVFADTFTKTFKKVIKVPSVVIDDPIFRLHYKFTGLALLFASILVSGYQFFGDPIMCIQRDDVPDQLLNTYCWIEGTFTLPKALFKEVGTEVVHPGVDNYNQGDEVVEHSYYQWVCFVLFLQAIIFCLPHYLWRTLESGRMKSLVQKLRNPIVTTKECNECFSGLACYFRGRKFEHQHYAIKFLLCEVLNFVNVIAQIYFIDLFLGGQFRKYGTEVVKYVNEEQENRLDPMIKIFPRITKCTFHKYGSSGDVQKHDALCLLPLNILNEKIFIVMWFWFVILAVLDGGLLIYRLIVIISGQSRYLLLSCVASLTSRNDIKSLIPSFTYGDWFLLYLLADNIDNIHFRKFVLQLKNEIEPGKTFDPVIVKLDDVDKGSSSKDFSKDFPFGGNKDESSV
ncbi:innexin inx2 [Caerostris darwini]|uniref:Innexin n=1 Tax=Caerostris darwini TaxID=1538125 RepID=A0AAV4P8Y2_9ARAC|nr:innexin inx2 [Caerostris darwini]